MLKDNKIIAIDIGGTTIKGGIINSGFQLSRYRKIDTENEKGFAKIRSNIHSLVASLIQEEGKENIAKIAISSAGQIDSAAGKVIYATDNLYGFTGYEIKNDIEAAFGVPAFVLNDACAALLCEKECGAGKGYGNIIMLTLGTGLGGAVIKDGRLVDCREFIAGSLGHTQLYPDGEKCNCGGNGCAEIYISANALKRAVGAGKGLQEAFKDIKIVEAFIGHTNKFIKILKQSYNPELIIFGGGVIYFKKFWLDKISEANPDIKILPAENENEAGIMGAAVFANKYSNVI